MTFTGAISACLSKYVQFSGRASRSEFWYFVLFQAITFFVAALVDQSSILLGFAWLALLLPGLAVTVRRLHDTGRSGWWYLIQLVPIIGSILLIVWLATEGSTSTNAYGDPVAAAPDAYGNTLKLAPENTARSDVAQQLAELSQLRDAGHLTVDEFERAKAKALNSP